MSLEVYVQHDPLTQHVDIYVIQPGPQGRHLLQLGGDVGVWEPLADDGRVIKPTLRIPPRVAEALRDALNGDDLPAPSPSQLADVIAVRDRLLVLAEALTEAQSATVKSMLQIERART